MGGDSYVTRGYFGARSQQTGDTFLTLTPHTLSHGLLFAFLYYACAVFVSSASTVHLFLVILTRQFVCRLVCFLPEWHSQVSPPATEPPSYVSQTKHFGDQMDHFKYVQNKCTLTEDLCREQEIAFIPIVAESSGGWHRVALEQFQKLGSILARQTG